MQYQATARRARVAATKPGAVVKHKGRETVTATTQTRQEHEGYATEIGTGLLPKLKVLKEKQQR